MVPSKEEESDFEHGFGCPVVWMFGRLSVPWLPCLTNHLPGRGPCDLGKKRASETFAVSEGSGGGLWAVKRDDFTRAPPHPHPSS